jgi:hypothetical protein
MRIAKTLASHRWTLALRPALASPRLGSKNNNLQRHLTIPAGYHVFYMLWIVFLIASGNDGPHITYSFWHNAKAAFEPLSETGTRQLAG